LNKKILTILIIYVLSLLLFQNVNSVELINEEKTIQNHLVDWWPMIHHDLNHTGYSTSTGPITNNTLWVYTFDVHNYFVSPVVADEKIYCGFSGTGSIYCCNYYTGQKIWEYDTNGAINSAPAVSDGKVYFGTPNSKIYCLNANTGDKIWEYETGGGVGSSPAVYNGMLYIGSGDYNIYCLNANNGEKIWNYTTGGHIGSSPAISDGKVYIGSWDNNLYCLNADTGEKIWSYTTGREVYPSPTIVNGNLYIGSGDSKIYCLNADTGEKIWSYKTNGPIVSTTAFSNGMIYFGSFDNNIYCLNAYTGEKIWNYTTGDVIFSSPAIADGKVYIGSRDYKLYCLSAVFGVKIWDYTTDGVVDSDPAIADGKVFIGSLKNIYCFGDESMNNPPNTPFINGETNGAINTPYDYYIVTTDPDNDNVRYHIDWGDNNSTITELYQSEEEIIVSHTWTTESNYNITVKAIDQFYSESDWSTLEVSMPKNKETSLSNTIVVPDDYPTIQEAIDNADFGDTVFVRSGTYSERLYISKSINLIGEDKNNTIIDGSGYDNAIRVDYTPNHEISGFTIKNIGYNNISNQEKISSRIEKLDKMDGILLWYSEDNYIHDNIFIVDNIGLYLARSHNNNIVNNTIFSAYIGVLLVEANENIIKNNDITEKTTTISNYLNYGSWGILLDNDIYLNTIQNNSISFFNTGIYIGQYSFNNNIVDNILTNNANNGIWGSYENNNNTIQDNRIFENGNGFGMWMGKNNLISNNIIGPNNEKEIFLRDCYDNVVKNNIILGNDLSIGIHISTGANNNIESNNISNNEYGLYLYNTNNHIYMNNIFANSKNAFFESGDNSWEANYWGKSNIIFNLILGRIELGNFFIPWFNVDWRPAKTPYDI